MAEPGFFRLIVDSYRDPDYIGSGDAIVIASAAALERLREGDSVAVLGKIAGTDLVVGSMIVCADDMLVLDRATGERDGCARTHDL
jgi:hypothetical protein